MPSCDPLPSKESSLFKRILKSYEKKQYKNGLKFAKQILSNQRFADHGETLAMKGLILNCLGKKEEAFECVKRGLKYDLKSHVCWHAYGLLQRSDHKYEEAIKCYRNALKLDKDNGQILRDLSFLQIQMRDLEGYRDTRYHLFLLRPTPRVTWIGYAMAYHLLKEYDMCLKILNSFKKTLFPTDYDYYEFSEFLLYQNLVIQESGNFEDALKHLQEHKDHICDKIVYKENLVNIFIQLGLFKEAEIQIQSLINDNPNNASYFNMLSVVLHSDTDHQYLSLLYELSASYPKASMPQQLILKYTYGKEFSSKIDEYLINGLRKGKPSLFISVCPLYSDKEKVKVIEELVESYLFNLKTSGHFHKSEVIENKEATATILWVYYFLSQHFDILGNSEQALHHINNALDHTPTLIDLYVMKAKIYKHAGDLVEACNWMDEAQELDTADRFLNSKCTKYLLRADLIDEAEEMSSKFTKNGSVMENLNEMQCLWFQTECALAYQRLGNWGEALKKCFEVERHFLEITEDQFDFHSYCMRKMTLRSYVGLLRLEDVLRSHSFYRKVAKCAIEVYISLHDEPLIDKKIYDKKATPHILNDDLSPSELKKIKSKQRKAQKKAELQAEINAALERKDSMKRSKPKPYDPDCDYLHHEELDPKKLTKISDPLNQAVKFLLPLQKLCSDQVETHILAYEIYSRKLKPLLMLQSVKRAYSVNSENPRVHSILIHFSRQMLEWETKGSFDINVSVVIKAQMEPILNGNLPEDINANFISNHNGSVLDILEGARMMYKIDNSKQKEALEFLLTINSSKKDFNINSCIKVLFVLRNGDFGHCVEAIESFRSMFHSKFPLATAFFGSEC